MPEISVNKSLQDKINQGRQYRTMKMEVVQRSQETDGYIVKGYATTFDEPYLLFKDGDFEYWEKVDRYAFSSANMGDVIFQYDHVGRVFARISNGTLKVRPDDHGLFIEADLGGTEEGRKLYEEIAGGYTTKMSFGFTIDEEEDLRTNENGMTKYTVTIKKIGTVYDVSAVSLPANDGTEISARNLVNGVIARHKQADEQAKKEQEEKERQEQEEMEMRERKRLAALAL